MPSIKTNQFPDYHIENSKIGRALAHPARLRIIELLHSNTFVRNIDLINYLSLSQPSVSNHIKKLAEAELIQFDFSPNSSTYITLHIGAEERLRNFIEDVFD